MFLGLFPLAAFSSLSLLCMLNVLIIMWCENFLFWSNIFGVLWASYTFIGISFFGKLSSVTSLKKFLRHLFDLGLFSFLNSCYSWVFGLFIASQISWMFYVRTVFRFNVFLDHCSHVFYCIFNAWDSFFHLLYFIGAACLCGYSSNFLSFNFQNSLNLYFLYCFYFHL